MMAKVPKHIKLSLACLAVFLCSITNILAVDPKNTDGDETEKDKKELVDERKAPSDSEKTIKADSDKVKDANKLLVKPKQEKVGTKVKKTDNSKSSLVSYNFVFYLMYKFKIADIFDLSKEKNSIKIPSKNNYQELGLQLIKKIVDKVNNAESVKH